MATETQDKFLRKLDALISETEIDKPFKGKAKAVRALKRIRNLSDFK